MPATRWLDGTRRGMEAFTIASQWSVCRAKIPAFIRHDYQPNTPPLFSFPARPIRVAMPGMKHLLILALGWLAISSIARAADAPYRHVVLFKFKDEAPAAEVKKIEDAFVGLKDKIDLITDFEWGLNVSPEGHDQGFTHVYFVTFKNKADLEKYLPHPDHKEFVALLMPQLDKVLVVDYVAKK
jgi:hypothetical protein